ncbi:relaxase/mobilization nuclease domain-containing protein [Methylotenera sp.]|uniref:relaxase/mobilization nuclease domain-containing protein n=1 Tax=Methylotenera sp. TaxID=2051956 RepID=UPI00248A3599|nr:relaxase/mobilization nuclease domain-containing protein [Methylotenera sp.]MDI1298615.1 relaxase/mobilization nuclease domain-containing protein [Methylotenera sp.]
MAEFDPIDHWFDKGFRIEKTKRPKAAAITKVRAASGHTSAKAGVKFSSSAKIKNIKSVINKSPEVVVKITGKSNGLKTLKNHLDYISRNGELELKNEREETIKGRAGLKDIQNELKALKFIPDESKDREYIHVLFSMPASTPEAELKSAVEQFCKEEFANRRYVMALHNDTDHTHMHVAVGTRDKDNHQTDYGHQERLSPRKNDLFRWRQGFADKLRENGIDAAASERRHRFNYRKAENATVRQIKDKTSNTPKVSQDLAEEIKVALKAGNRPLNPALEKAEANKQEALEGWQKVAENLEASGDNELAKKVRAFMSEADNPIVTRNQELYDKAQEKDRGKEEVELDL